MHVIFFSLCHWEICLTFSLCEKWQQ
uniref:Uncharacterized protein n=1 Tax=Rhizophora mucronata TaxID=61149 RepID=A0A2P2PLF8_RHIMU